MNLHIKFRLEEHSQKLIKRDLVLVIKNNPFGDVIIV